MAEHKLLPDLIISSTAKRAKDTAVLTANTSGYRNTIALTQDLYETTTEGFIKILRQVAEPCASVMLVGHNPEMEEFVGHLINQSFGLGTAHLVHLKLPIESWKDLKQDTRAKLVDLLQP